MGGAENQSANADRASKSLGYAKFKSKGMLLRYAGIFVLAILLQSCNQNPTTESREPKTTDSTKKAPNPSPEPKTVHKESGPSATTPKATPTPTPKTKPTPTLHPQPQFLKGKFVEVQEGDYPHIVLLDEKGRRRSFFVAQNIPKGEIDPFLTDHTLRGKTVEVTWRRVDRFLEAAGATNQVDEITSIAVVGE
jgi:hypothetical protein